MDFSIKHKFIENKKGILVEGKGDVVQNIRKKLS